VRNRRSKTPSQALSTPPKSFYERDGRRYVDTDRKGKSKQLAEKHQTIRKLGACWKRDSRQCPSLAMGKRQQGSKISTMVPKEAENSFGPWDYVRREVDDHRCLVKSGFGEWTAKLDAPGHLLQTRESRNEGSTPAGDQPVWRSFGLDKKMDFRMQRDKYGEVVDVEVVCSHEGGSLIQEGEKETEVVHCPG